MISTTEIEYFLALESHRSFTSAAQTLGISQPTLTVAIGRLEKKVGSPLFHRSSAGIALSSVGEALLPSMRHARDAVSSVQRSAALVADLRLGTLRLACRPSLAREPVARVIQRLHRAHPEVGLEVAHLRDGSSPRETINAGIADLAITTTDDNLDGLEVEPLGDLVLVAVVPPDAELPDRPRVADLVALGLLSATGFDVVSRALARIIDAPTIVEATTFDSDYHALLVRLAMSGCGVLFVPERMGEVYRRSGARIAQPVDRPVLHVVGATLPGQCPPVARRFLDLAHARHDEGGRR